MGHQSYHRQGSRKRGQEKTAKDRRWGGVLRNAVPGRDIATTLLLSQWLWLSAQDGAPSTFHHKWEKGEWGSTLPGELSVVNGCWETGVIFFCGLTTITFALFQQTTPTQAHVSNPN